MKSASYVVSTTVSVPVVVSEIVDVKVVPAMLGLDIPVSRSKGVKVVASGLTQSM